MTTANFGPKHSELSRLGTYSGFQSPLGVWPLQLAQAGFCRDRTCGDFEVVCFSCGFKLNVRNLPRQPVMEIHKTMSPSCSFVIDSLRHQPVSLAPLRYGASQLRTNQYVNSFGPCSLPNWGSSRSQCPAFSSLPQLSESFSQVSLPRVSQSLPQVTDSTLQFSFGEEMDLLVGASDSFSQFSSLPVLPAGPSQTLSSDTLEPSVLPSLPSDFLSNFQDAAFLASDVFPDVLFEGDSSPQSLADSSSGYRGFSNPSSEGRDAAYFSQSETGVALGGPGEVMVTDGDTLEPEHDVRGVQASSNSPQSPVTQSAATSSEPPARKITFEEMGIVTRRPKHQDYATVQFRLATFDSAWKNKAGQCQTKEVLAEAGFYYAGYADCCRCFYCGGALKNWEREDHPWVEHCRWFKDCPYVILSLGQDFVEAVQSLSRPDIKISWFDVEEEIHRMKPEERQRTTTSEASWLQRQDSNESLDFEDVDDVNELAEAAMRLESENAMLKQQNICKVCLDKEVSILYVPCGHLVTCSVCSPAESVCPACGQRVKGQVRVTCDA